MWRDEAYLLDMLLAARDAQEFLGELPLDRFAQDRLRQSAVLRQLEIIGEAASKVSDGCRASRASIPWAEIIGMRNRLAHEYQAVDLERVWHTVTGRVPELIELLEQIIPPATEVD